MGTTRQESGSDSWGEFIDRVRHYDQTRRAAMMRQTSGDEKLAMIVRLASQWRDRYTSGYNEQNKRNAIARWVRREGMRLRVGQLRRYVDNATYRAMPAPRIRTVERGERLRNRALAAAFFRRGWSRAARSRPALATILERERTDVRLWLLCHPYGPAVPDDALARLKADLNAHRPRKPQKRPSRNAVNPAGMTADRALEIAIHAMNAGH